MKFGIRSLKRTKASTATFIVLCLLLAVSFCQLFSPVALAQETSQADQRIRVILTWTDDPATTQTITWLMTGNSQASVQYLNAEEYNGSFDVARQVDVDGIAFDSSHYRYTATLTGLSPGTQYVYRVGREGAWSEPLSFSTSPANPENFTFLYLGDVQSGYTQWGSLLDEISSEYPQIGFALLGGDLTDNGDDEEEWGEFLDAAAGLFSRIPAMPTMGNHDGSMYEKFFALPDNGPEGLKQEFYSFDYGNAHFVVLNSNKNADEAAKQWLQEDLQNTAKKWRFAVFHHPAYPVVDDYKGIAESIRSNWVPLLEQYGVDMVFVGHQHVYMRTRPLRDGQIRPDGEGIVYVMGNAGTKYYSPGPDRDYIAKQVAWVSNYQVIDIDGDTLTMTARDADGQVIDTCTIVKQPVGGNSVYTITPIEDTAYQIGATPDAINTMTVVPGVSGMKYFGVQVAPVIAHEGKEAVVFAHMRNGVQLSLSVTKADFDTVGIAKAGFHVQPGDVVKVYMVDQLTDAIDCNPMILQ